MCTRGLESESVRVWWSVFNPLSAARYTWTHFSLDMRRGGGGGGGTWGTLLPLYLFVCSLKEGALKGRWTRAAVRVV